MKKYLIGLLTASLLGACSWMPSPTQQGPQSQIQADVLTTASTASNSQSQPRPPEKITFPSMVKTTEAQDVPDDEISQLKALLESEWGFSILGDDKDKKGDKDDKDGKDKGKDEDRDDHDDRDSDNHHCYALDFKSKKAEGKHQVQMPATGSFKLVMEAGSKFEVLDNNATDGEAKVRIPAGQLDTLIRLAGESKQNSPSLEINDELYYVKDTLSLQKPRSGKGKDDDKERWFKLGVRPLPVPSDWYSPDGNQFILKLKSTNVKDFQMVWKRVRGTVPYPPGINKIGPAGGVIELPGVAKMEFFNGSIPTSTTVVIRQVKEAATRKIMCDNPYIPDECHAGWVHAAPIIKIEPMSLILNQAARLDLPIYEYFKRYSPRSIQDVASEDVFNVYSWEYFPYLAEKQDIENLMDITDHNFPLWVQQFAYVSRQMHYTKTVEPFFQGEQFRVQNFNPNCLQTKSFQDDATEHLYILDNDGIACPEALDRDINAAQNIKRFVMADALGQSVCIVEDATSCIRTTPETILFSDSVSAKGVDLAQYGSQDAPTTAAKAV